MALRGALRKRAGGWGWVFEVRVFGGRRSAEVADILLAQNSAMTMIWFPAPTLERQRE